MNIFTTLMQGDSAAWTDDAVVLPDGRQAVAGAWWLIYVLRGPSGLNLTASAAGMAWRTTLTAAASASLLPGAYAWIARVVSDTERVQVGEGSLTISPDLDAVSTTLPYDTRSAAKRALDACEVAMSSFNATGGKVKKYEIAGRLMEFQTIGELMQLHNFWRSKVMQEGTADSIAAGLGNPRTLHVRFGRP